MLSGETLILSSSILIFNGQGSYHLPFSLQCLTSRCPDALNSLNGFQVEFPLGVALTNQDPSVDLEVRSDIKVLVVLELAPDEANQLC